MNTKINLSEGGTVAFLYNSKIYTIPKDYEFHKQLISIKADEMDNVALQRVAILPSNCRCVVMTEAIPKLVYQVLQAEIRKKNIVYLVRKNENQIIATFKELFTASDNGYKDVEIEPKEENQQRGRIQQLLKDEGVDFNKSSAEEARRLFQIAKQKGIQTTFASIAQAISTAKRKMGATGVPRSIMSPKVLALKILDEAIDNLNSIREYVLKTEEENNSLRDQLRNIKRAMGVE